MQKYTQKILDIIFPPKCAGCNKIAKHIICADCLQDIMRESMRTCQKCRKPPYLCSCKKIDYIEEVAFPYFYHGEKLKFAIFKLKRANLYYINEFFAKGMYNSIKTGDKINVADIDFITCIPRVKKYLNIYGYNQAEKLAKIISGYSGIKFVKCLKQTGNQKEQKTLGKSERLLNVRDKYIIDKKADIENKNIMIVDDVATTGATLSECAKVLKNAGAGKIYALCATST
jgi:ComF family protein